MTTFAALGDSITLGIGDPAPGRTWRGWAALLADGLPGARLHNLATSGAQAAGGRTARPVPGTRAVHPAVGHRLAYAPPAGRHLTS